MLFAIGLVTMFTIGGLSGVTHAVAPSDTQQTDTYYIVAHFHYVIFGGALLGFLGGIYFWWPKVFGYLLNEKLGQVALLDDPDRLQPDVRADAHPRPAGHAAPHAHLRRGLRLRLLEHGVDRRRVHHRRVDADLRRQHPDELAQAPGQPGRPRPRPVGRPQPRVDGPVAGAGAQLRRGARPCRTSTSSGTASTRRTTRARSCGSPPAPRSPSRATPPASTCRRRRTGRSCWPSACRSSATASSSTWASPPSAA